MTGPLRRRIIVSYVLDYVIMIAFVVGFYFIDSAEPFHQPFALANYTLQYPYATKERVTIVHAMMISAGFPVVVILVTTLLLDGMFSHRKPVPGTTGYRARYTLKDRLWQLNCGIMGLFLAQASAFVLTDAMKICTGKPRPDLIDRCQPPLGSHDPPLYGLSTYKICTQTDKAILRDGFKSFPSGHSSSSFSGLFYISLFIAGKLHIWDNRGEVWKTVFVIAPTLAAALIAISRIMDARHHPFDVITGGLLGIVCAWGSYRQYFPPLSDTEAKGRAYPIRTWGTDPRPRYNQLADLPASDTEAAAYQPPIPLQSQPPPGQDPRLQQEAGISSGHVLRQDTLENPFYSTTYSRLARPHPPPRMGTDTSAESLELRETMPVARGEAAETEERDMTTPLTGSSSVYTPYRAPTVEDRP